MRFIRKVDKTLTGRERHCPGVSRICNKLYFFSAYIRGSKQAGELFSDETV